MRRFTAFVILIGLFLSGCTLYGERIKEPVTFYYIRSDYGYFEENSVFVPEEKEASGHRDDLSYLLRLYLMGPSDEELTCPLPRGTWIVNLQQTEHTIRLELSDNTRELSDLDYSLACSCLALTCFDLTQANSVTVTSGERSIALTRETLVLHDTNQDTVEETQ